MPARAAVAALLTVCLPLAMAGVAYANDNGEGLVGETNDKIITYTSLGLIIGVTLFVIIASAIQALLDKRKEERKAADLRRRVGW
jgi:nitrogen fixation/metabolism regulation signal transduction histidine kinase